MSSCATRQHSYSIVGSDCCTLAPVIRIRLPRADRRRTRKTGAQGYLLKDTPRADLLEIIRAVARGQKRIPPEVAARWVDRIGAPTLMDRELDVLRLMAHGHSKAIGTALHISEGTVTFHVNNILGKRGAEDRTQAVTSAIQRGIIHLDELPYRTIGRVLH